MGKRIENPMFPMNHVIQRFMQQTLEQIDANMLTQRVWPNEVYTGYAIKNAANKRDGLPHSTGEGAKSFRGKILHAQENGNVTLLFAYNDYMRYVEIGVGGHTKHQQVERGKNYKYKSRYISQWDRGDGESHRPFVMPELNHLQSRIRNYLVDFYGYEMQVALVNTLTEGDGLVLF